MACFTSLVPESGRTPQDVQWVQSQPLVNNANVAALQNRLSTSKSQLNKTATMENYRAMAEEYRKQGREVEGLRELGKAQAFCTQQEQVRE